MKTKQNFITDIMDNAQKARIEKLEHQHELF